MNHGPVEPFYFGVIGPGDAATTREREIATEVGRLVAESGHIVVTGGLNGVMEAACAGAQAAGGTTVGILPGLDRSAANQHLTVALPTGLGELRNGLIVRACAALICVGGSWGTLNELSLAVRTGVPAVAVAGWRLPAEGVITAASAAEAVDRATQLAAARVAARGRG